MLYLIYGYLDVQPQGLADLLFRVVSVLSRRIIEDHCK